MYNVYLIKNLITWDLYVGVTSNLKDRWRTHRSIATNPNSPSYHRPLYQDFREYGLDNFSFEVLESEITDETLALEIEKYWIDRLKTKYPNGHNLTDGGKGIKGHFANDEIRKIRSESTIGIPKPVGFGEIVSKAQGKGVYMIDKASSSMLKEFISTHKAAEWIRENTDYKTANFSKIAAVCRGDRKSIYGFNWEYKNKGVDINE